MVDVEGTSLSVEDRALLEKPAVGAVILFSRNYQSREQVKGLVAEIKALRTPSLLVAVDQEGGRVQRFRDGFADLPPALAFGRAYDENPARGEQFAESAGTLMATEILGTGIDFSFAPVLDCANPGSTAIGDRGFHPAPEVISILAGAFIRGMKSAGMAATGKHFPGHGGVTGDSHDTLPVDNRTLDEITRCDLVPYSHLAAKLQGVMTAHVVFPEIDSAVPTFSRFWINSMLRKQFGFSGMVFSDDLSMKGAHVAGTPLQRTRNALEAGCDMALICNDPASAIEVARQLGSSVSLDRTKLDAMRRGPAIPGIHCGKLKESLLGCVC
jgi:beta-N-acetylhexosaminidase